ncbi:calmodulin-like isoform X1 [Ptychodera flava]|uniref:calmodulin-like isoform X1 n=1 Tax=Ptychodera flava TaxID=63121 RepID=UPI00396A26D6
MGCTSSSNKMKNRRWVSGPYTSQTTETTTLTTTTQNQGSPCKEKFTREDILLIFKAMDKDGNGYLTADEIRQTLVETKAYENEEQVQKMITEADRDGDGRINYLEFTGVMDFVNSKP